MMIISKTLSGRQAKDYYQEDYSDETNLSQGCARCDALWGGFPLTEEFRRYVVDPPYSAESGHIIPIFEVDISRLFDEGEAPQTGV